MPLPYAELMFTPVSRDQQPPPLGARLVPRGAARKAVVVYDGTLARAPVWHDGRAVQTDPARWRWDRECEGSLPPRPDCLRACADVLASPRRYGLGKGTPHVFLDLERGQTPAQLADAVRVLRASLGADAPVSVYGFPQWGYDAPGAAELLELVTSPSLFPDPPSDPAAGA